MESRHTRRETLIAVGLPAGANLLHEVDGDDAVEDPRVLLRFFIYQHNTDQSPVVDLIAEEEMGQDNSSSCPFLLFPSWSSRAEFLVGAPSCAFSLVKNHWFCGISYISK